MEKVFKAFSAISKAIDLEAGIFEAMISTEAVDRSGDIVRATGAKLENYLKNPVVLWAHDYSEPPVAKSLGIEIIPGQGLRAKFQFPEWGSNPHADTVRRLWSAGFLNATSIGFIPLASKPVDSAKSPDSWWEPQEYTSWELLEFSIVPVPANQEALKLAVKNIHETIQKRGRILSAGNEKKLRDAANAINDVLSQLEDEEPEKAHATTTSTPSDKTDDGKSTNAEANIALTSNNATNATVEKINQLLQLLFEVKNGS